MKALSKEELRYLNALKRQRAIIDAREKLIPFARYMKPDPNHPDDTDFSTYEVARHHEVIAHALEAVEAGTIRRLIVNCPPRHGKSELASRLFPTWYVGRNTGSSIIAASYNEKFSWDFGREVRQIIEDPAYGQVFPEVRINTASVDRIETESGTKLFFTGRGGSHHRPRQHRAGPRRPAEGPGRGGQSNHARESLELVQPGRHARACSRPRAGSS